MSEGKHKYPCIDCEGDAYIGYTNWVAADGFVIVGSDERICQKCFESRKTITKTGKEK